MAESKSEDEECIFLTALKMKEDPHTCCYSE